MGASTYRNARLTPWSKIVARSGTYLSGAVYDADGKLIEESLRLPGVNPAKDVNPARINTVSPAPNRLTGNWLYGGIWFDHFGHFLLETITRLPIGRAPYDGIIFHTYGRHVTRPFHTELLNRLGNSLPILMATSEFVVDQLTIAPQALELGKWIDQHAVDVWMALSDDFRPHRRVFYSRSRLQLKSDRGGINDVDLDEEFASRDFEVRYPESMSVADQIALMAETDVLAGVSGSALHGSVFMAPEAAVVEIGDRRARTRKWHNQLLIDAKYGRRELFVTYSAQGGEPLARDIAATMREFDEVLAGERGAR